MRFKLALFAILLAFSAHLGLGATVRLPFEKQNRSASALAIYIGNESDAALDAAAAGDGSDASWSSSRNRVKAVFDIAIAFGGANDLDGFREAAFARRLLAQLQTLAPENRVDLLKYLRVHDELARTLAFSVRPGDHVQKTYQLINQWRKERAQQVDKLPNLAVALAIVRSRPLSERINENIAEAAPPRDVFDYYAGHESQMVLGLSGMPVELLVYVVDTTASVEDMNWSLRKYGNDPNVGPLFFEIQYDYDSFEKGTQKKLDRAGFSLPNILKFGGVCIDQAYFAESVGKSIGVPTAIATAAAADVGHAWIGYLQVKGSTAAWNFDTGR
ncbi:MAG: hypothetical protein JO353_02240, partial [Phycisphaerae bacterium]|nr:hypothetical protein [Phycisphaerae bacterium]